MMGGYQGVGEIMDDKIIFGKGAAVADNKRVFSKESEDDFKLLNHKSLEQVIPIVDNAIKKH